MNKLIQHVLSKQEENITVAKHLQREEELFHMQAEVRWIDVSYIVRL